MLLLGVDVETTGLSPDEDKIIELGAVLWDTAYNTPVDMLSCLIRHEEQAPLEPIITKITGITNHMLDAYGYDVHSVFSQLMGMVDMADYMVAHNAPFDRGFVENLILSEGDDADNDKIRALHWLDTDTDLPIDRELCKYSNLLYMAAYHGVINPFGHRAVTDVLTMMQVLSKYELAEVISRSKSPTVRVYCYPGFKGKDAPKAAGFRYNGEDKSWAIQAKVCDVDMKAIEDGSAYDFEYKYEVLGDMPI